ncbi:hypothetical protein DFQ27_005999 [Actinomortierella ambigua]|uniref:Uncharacterized protein n=1 Tax=Actinomortierella ambigua TaxID=1343610 RepID=A0A9P6Q0G7_9FUNG|nr:hypothetical protein DFQ27_005999 [Actinomortierella ambigua]
MAFPYQPSEAWPGEVTSEALAQRQRKQREWGTRQNTGHKIDVLVVISDHSLEICYMEAAKENGGANTAKCLHDTRKLMKLMKDRHNMILEKAVQDVRSRLVTFSLCISGPAATIFSLRQCTGRVHLSIEEDIQSFTLVWMADDTSTILAVIASFLKLRKAVMAMAASVSS